MFSRFRPRSHGPGSRNSDASMGRNDTRVRSTRSRAEDGLHSHTIKKGKDDGFPTLTAKGGMSLGLRTTEWLKDAHLYTASDNKMSPGLAIVFASTPPAITLPPEDPPIPEGAGGQGVVAKVILASHLEKLKRLETLREKFNLDKQALFYKCRYAIDDYLWAKLEEGFAEYPEMMEAHDLAMLVSRIYVALVNIRSGNPEKDKYNLAKKFFELKMHHNESIVDFKKRIEDYENERVAYELPLLSEGEMVTAILEKVEPQLRPYADTVLSNQRIMGTDLPATRAILWKQLSQYQTAATTRAFPATGSLRTAFVVDHTYADSGKGRGRGQSGGRGSGRGGRGGRGNHGGRSGRGGQGQPSALPAGYVCYDCNRPGHRRYDSACPGPSKSVPTAETAITPVHEKKPRPKAVYMISHSSFAVQLANEVPNRDDAFGFVDEADRPHEVKIQVSSPEVQSTPVLRTVGCDEDSIGDDWEEVSTSDDWDKVSIPSLVDDSDSSDDESESFDDDDSMPDLRSRSTDSSDDDNDSMPGLTEDSDSDDETPDQQTCHESDNDASTAEEMPNQSTYSTPAAVILAMKNNVLRRRLLPAGTATELDDVRFKYNPNSEFLCEMRPQRKTLKIILDTGSGQHIFGDRECFVYGSVGDAEEVLICNGVGGGSIRTQLKGELNDIFGDRIVAYFCHDMKGTNILSYSLLSETHSIVTVPHGFKATPLNDFPAPTNGSRGLVFLKDEESGHYHTKLMFLPVLHTEGVSQRNLHTARAAYDLMPRLAWPSYGKLASLVASATMKDIEVTHRDVALAQKLFGPPIPLLLGAGTQAKTRAPQDDEIPVQVAQNDKLDCDLFFVSGQVFFLSVSHNMCMIMVTHLGPATQPPTGSTKQLKDGSKSKAGAALVAHITQYHLKGIKVLQAIVDGEKSVEERRSEIESLGCLLIVLGHGSHASRAEITIRRVKEGARSTLASLPFRLPSSMIEPLIYWVVRCLNMFPQSNSMGGHSAFVQWRGRYPSLKYDARFRFAEFGILQNRPRPGDNDMGPRGVHVLWAGHTGNGRGTNLCWSLQTGKFLTGDIFRPASLTNDIVLRIHEFASGLPDIPGPPSDAPEPILPDLQNVGPLDHTQGVFPMLLPPGTEPVQDDYAPDDPVDAEAPIDHVPVELQEAEQANAEPIPVDLAPSPAIVDPPRHSLRSGLRESTVQRHVYATSITIQDAISEYGAVATDAIKLELTHLLNKDVLEFVPKNTPFKKGILSSKMMMTVKTKPDGSFDKVKARLVAGGHLQDRTIYNDNDISSPTVALESVLIVASMAADNNDYIMGLDHSAAYLNAEMKGPVDVLITMPTMVSEVLSKMDPKYTLYVRENGKIIVKLKKALYGCIQSALLWYNELSSTLLDLGFIKNPYDQCVFKRTSANENTIILLYVDDLMITSNQKEVLIKIDSQLRAKYGGVTSTIGHSQDFLGMHFDFGDREVAVTMKGYLENLMTKYGIVASARTPALNNLYVTSPTAKPLIREKQQLFHSVVMEIHYLAKRVFPQVMTTIAYLATRVLTPDEDDEKKLDRLLAYLYRVKDQALILRISAPNSSQLSSPTITAYVDMAYGVYPDMKSVTGILIKVGSASVFWKSSKQKVVTKSTTEGELVAVSDALSQILWTKEFLQCLGCDWGPVEIFQDNKSTIALANKGRSTSERTRHINVRYFFVHQFIESNEVKITYLPTDLMVADALTKPLTGALFETHKLAMIGGTA